MARIRSVKPEFWTSGQVLECSRNARLLFIGLWNFCDDQGRHPLRAKQIKAQIYPSDDLQEKDILGMLSELSKNGLITTYTVDNQEYLQVNGWHHQRIDKPQPAKYPPPLQDDSGNILGTLPPDRIGEDKIGSERRGKDTNGRYYSVSQATRFDEFWSLYPVHREKKKSLEIWKRRNLDTMADTICHDIRERQRHDKQWKDGYIPHPTTYLRNDRWEDEFTKPGQKDGYAEFLERHDAAN